MKKCSLLLCILLLCISHAGAENLEILLLVPHHYGANYNFNIDHFQEMGFITTTAGINANVVPCNSGLPLLTVDTLISEIQDISMFDAVVVMPSRWFNVAEPYNDLITSPEALALISEAASSSIPVWATCAGPLVLAAADVLSGVTIQGRTGPDSSFVEIYEAAGANFIGWGLLPVIDQNIITTSRGQYYQRENCQALVSTAASSGTVSRLNNRAGDFSQGARDIAKTSDNFFILTGYDFSNTGCKSDLLLQKTDLQGNTIWTESFGSDGFEYGNCVIEASNGDYIACGYTTSAGNEDFYLVRTDSDASLVWETTFGGDSLDIAMSVTETSDGKILICGYTTENTAGESDVLLILTNNLGNILWEKRYGGPGPETADHVQITSDGNILITGSTGSFTSNSDAYSLLTDIDGNIIREDYYGAQGGDGGYDRANSAVETSEGNIAMTGESNDPDNCGMYFILADCTGEMITETFHGNIFYDYSNDIVGTPDGGFLIVGATKDRYSCDNNLFVVKLNENGEEVWAEEFGEESTDEWGTAIAPTGTGSYMVAGQRETENGDYDVYLIEIEDTSQGASPEDQNLLSVYPNPAAKTLSLLNATPGTSYNIFDTAGRMVSGGMVNETSTGIDLIDLPVGVYTLATCAAGNSTTLRFTVLR